MQIVMIGTGGGRINLVKQFRGTGGFRINGSVSVHVDPGPGALTGSLRFRQDPSRLGVLFVSHSHIDHCNDANLMIEAMTGVALRKRGALVAGASVVDGMNDERPISKYHLSKLESAMALVAGKSVEVAGVKFTGTKTKHDDPTCVGFVLEMDGEKIGYTSDTEYFPGVGLQFAGCRYLVVNNLKPKDNGIPDHLSTDTAIKLIGEAKPGAVILSHLGAAFVRKPAEVDAQLIAEATGVKTIAGKDGMTFGDLGSRRKVYRLEDCEEEEGKEQGDDKEQEESKEIGKNSDENGEAHS
ncbi:MAG: MBL fold metallo-hydrolase [Candidatus Micrarchaeota archaeon]|nr:MBL fold metallo-hydrolase [Candidatus Micrarchaeota archaeon]